MLHIVLLGDSIFDNASYVPGGPAVIDQLRQRLPDGWQATLLAFDGHVTDDVPSQLESLPADATHLVVSVGGNDALQYSGILSTQVSHVAEALQQLGTAQREFGQRYRAMLQDVIESKRPTIVCTIYDACPFASEVERQVIPVALSLFNDEIRRAAVELDLSVLELRDICTASSDYSELSPIEPSVSGGEKIVAKIVDSVTSLADSAMRRRKLSYPPEQAERSYLSKLEPVEAGASEYLGRNYSGLENEFERSVMSARAAREKLRGSQLSSSLLPELRDASPTNLKLFICLAAEGSSGSLPLGSLAEQADLTVGETRVRLEQLAEKNWLRFSTTSDLFEEVGGNTIHWNLHRPPSFLRAAAVVLMGHVKSHLVADAHFEDPAIQKAMLNLPAFHEQTARRILHEHHDEVKIARCSKCHGLLATPRAQQCLSCGYDWH
jgi:hypothetical protein